MIHSISGTGPTGTPFTIEFRRGVNIILSETSNDSSRTDTRNATGKSTLSAIIDFCLGADSSKSVLMVEALRGWHFTLTIDIGQQQVSVTRSVGDHRNRFYIKGDTSEWPYRPKKDYENSEYYYETNEWRAILGHFFFGLPLLHEKHYPTFRQVIAYFLRLGQYAYTHPLELVPKAPSISHIIPVTFLLGQNWEILCRWQCVNEQKKALLNQEETYQSLGIQRGALETELINLQEELRLLKKQLDAFNVHPEYQKISDEADRMTSEIQKLQNRITTLTRRLRQYEKSVQEESEASSVPLENIYREAGIVFPESLTKTLAQAQAFHKQLINNRRAFLESEMVSLRGEIKQCQNLIEEFVPKQSGLMKILATHGAIPEYQAISDVYVERKAHEVSIQEKIESIKAIKKQKEKYDLQIDRFYREAEISKEERMEEWKKAVISFNEITKALYSKEGDLILNISRSKGYVYSIEIGQRDKSTGISRMKVFAFDFVLLKLWALQENRINFLVHDSDIFDPVDSRQNESALFEMEKLTNDFNAQYICTINSDRLQNFESKEIQQFVVHTLKDNSPNGSLFGFEFNSEPLKKRSRRFNF